jgi:DNA modification methylase
MVKGQLITDKYALYNGDCIEVMNSMPDECVHMSIYSPPFAGLYQYSSDEADISNNINYEEFLTHYRFCVNEIFRLTMPGRMTAVHCMDVPSGNSGCDQLRDFPGDIIRLHESIGFRYVARYHVWKEPLTIRNRTMMKSLSHKCLTLDSTKCSIANADYLLIFRKIGQNPVPVNHPCGLTSYAGEKPVPNDILKWRGWKGSQLENRYSQWVWRQYASAFWDDVRLDRVLPHRECKEENDEKHVHPLQLDVIERAVIMWSNQKETILTPFMGVGSEVYGAVINKRKSVGVELKTSYYNQAVLNIKDAEKNNVEEAELFEVAK